MGRPRKYPDEMVVAKETGFINIDGVDFFFRRGVTRFTAGHPVVKAMPHNFEPIVPHYGVEQATAAPGELRGA